MDVQALLAHQLTGVGICDVDSLAPQLQRLLADVGQTYAAVFDSLGDGLCVLGAEGRLVFMNPQAELLLGWPLQELAGAKLFEAIDADMPSTSGGTYHEEDEHFRRKDGSMLPVMYWLTSLEHGGAVLLFRDMTPRQRRLAAQAQVARRQSLLQLTHRMVAESDAEHVLTELLAEAISVLGGQDGLITRWDPDRGGLVAVRNTMPVDADAILIEAGSGVSGSAVQHRSTYWTNEYQRQFGHTSAGRLGIRAAVAAPLIHQGRLMGALSVNSYDASKQFTAEDAECLELLAGVASGLLASLDRSAELASANTELRQARDEAQYQALHDSLTGLSNRTLLAERLQHYIETSEGTDSSFALLLMDLDRFKEVNDTLGHQAGDRLLQAVSRRLIAELRGCDTIARLGGDEFAVVLPDVDDVAAPAIAARLLEALELPYALDGREVGVGATMGIAVYPVHGDDADTLMRRADMAMYAAKRNHSGYRLASQDEQPATERLMLVSSLRCAIDNDELTLHYQPIIDCETGRIATMEALVRWHHPIHGLIPPDRFIPLAEETGLIGALTRWVLRTALRQLRMWQSDGVDLHIAVNLSAYDLQDSTLPDRVAVLLAESNVAAESVTLELTETAVMTDRERGLETLRALEALGLHIAIDDFGTGYSSLSYLTTLPAHELKIDRSFIRGLKPETREAEVVRWTIQMGRSLGFVVVAEGVEDESTLRHLTELGCDMAQGYALGRPQPAYAWQLAQPSRSHTFAA
ncbi:MAG: EAL domain-containing protein [Chloroflexi bacterium]|nr:EAL domain-containing protein [Chloroflexota bacterium]